MFVLKSLADVSKHQLKWAEIAAINDQIQSFSLKLSFFSFAGILKLVQVYHLWKSSDPARSSECKQPPVPEAVQATRLKTRRESDELRRWPGIRSAAWGWIGGWWLNSTIRGRLSHCYREYFRQWMRINELLLNQWSHRHGFAVIVWIGIFPLGMNRNFRAATSQATIQSSNPERRIGNDWSVLAGLELRLIQAQLGWHW